MSVKVHCKSCEKVLAVSDRFRGKVIKCPGCEAKLRVPDDEAQPAAAGAKKKRAAAAKPDSEAFLATMDLSRVEDTSVRLCPKCGAELGEEDTECAVCGIDISTGQAGLTARKRARKGPDPDLFYKGLWKDSWRFVGKNKSLAFRSILYTILFSVLFACALFMTLWSSNTPPKVFWGFLTVVLGLVPLGWYWFLSTEVIKSTLDKKEKLKRVNFDMFLTAALGIKCVAWHLVFGFPFVAAAAVLAFGLKNPLISGIAIGVGELLVMALLPVAMSHMSMPVQYRGWLLPAVFMGWVRTIKASLAWFGLFLLTTAPVIAGIVVIAALYGAPLARIAGTVERNSAIAAAQAQNENLRGAEDRNPLGDETPAAIDWMPTIIPSVVWVLCCTMLGFTALFNMRTNGQFTFYHKRSLGLISRTKEYKYVARARDTDEVEGYEQASARELITALALIAVVGVIGGTSYGFLSGNIVRGLGTGTFIAGMIINIVGQYLMSRAAYEQSWLWGYSCRVIPGVALVFLIMHWQETKQGFFVWLASLPLVGVGLAMIIATQVAEVLAELPPPPA